MNSGLSRNVHALSWPVAVACLVAVAGCASKQGGITSGDAQASSAPDSAPEAGPAPASSTPAPTLTLAPTISIESFLEPFPGVYSGGEPQGREELEQLAALGVKTIISVDGSEPDVETARQLGMRYVHVPIGYDGLETDQSLTIARALRDLPGPVFFHCYHGKHRGPAAAATAAVLTGRATNDEALAFLTTVGTSPNYAGLWACVREASADDAWMIDAAPADFPEVVHPDGLVGTMAAVGRALDNLKLLRDVSWAAHPDHPDLVGANEAGRLADDMRRIAEESAGKIAQGTADDYDRMMVRSAELAQSLEDLLLARDSGAPPTTDAITSALTALSRSCDDCHRTFRD